MKEDTDFEAYQDQNQGRNEVNLNFKSLTFNPNAAEEIDRPSAEPI